MPKEKVMDIAGTYDVQVSWIKDNYVQLGVEVNGGHSIGEMLSDAESSTTAFDFFGLWSTLDRDGIDRLIKVLRKAQKQAFPL